VTSSSPDALLREVRHLPAGLATAAFDPRVAVLRCDLEQSSEDGGIGRAQEFTLRQVPRRCRIEWIESDTGWRGRSPMLLRAHAGPDPMTALVLGPRDFDVRIGLRKCAGQDSNLRPAA
jgi:hypothetical protein